VDSYTQIQLAESCCGSLLWYLGNCIRPVRRVAEEAIPRSLKEQSSNVVRQYLLSSHMYYLTLVLYGCYFPVLVLVVASVVVATVLLRLGKLVLAMRRGILVWWQLIGGFAFRCSPPTSKLGSGKGAEPPIVYFERFLRDSRLSSKVWRVREQVRVPFLCSQQLPVNGFLLVNLDTGEYPSDSSYLPHQTIPLTFGGRARRHRWESSRVRDPFDHRAFHGSLCLLRHHLGLGFSLITQSCHGPSALQL